MPNGIKKLFGCRPTVNGVQSGMETASRDAGVVCQYDHFRRSDGCRFSQRSPPGAWMLAATTIYAAARSPHGTTSERPIPPSSSAKKNCQTLWIFWKVRNFGVTLCIKWCNWKCMVSEQSYMSARKWSLVVSSQPPEGGFWVPFSCSWGTGGGHTSPRRGTRYTLQPSRPPSSGTWGALLFPYVRLAGAHKQSVLCSGGKIVLALENSWAVPTFKNFNEKLKLAGALRREKRNWCSTAVEVMPYGHPPKLPRNTPQVLRNLARYGIGGFVTLA
jgi:hypothetical protein